jgi:hypothetical protein
MKEFRKIQQQDLKLQIIDKLHPKRILAEKYISDRYNSAFNAQLAVLKASFRYDLPMRGLGTENPQRFFESCSTGVSAPFSSLPSAQRDELRRGPARRRVLWLRPSSDPERKAAVADVRWQHPLPAQDAVPGKLAPRVGRHRLTCRRACSTDESTKSNGSTQDAAHIQPAGIRHARWLDWQRMSGK